MEWKKLSEGGPTEKTHVFLLRAEGYGFGMESVVIVPEKIEFFLDNEDIEDEDEFERALEGIKDIVDSGCELPDGWERVWIDSKGTPIEASKTLWVYQGEVADFYDKEVK